MSDNRGAGDFTPEQYEETILKAVREGGPVEELIRLYVVTHPKRGLVFYDDLRAALRLTGGKS